MTNFINILFVLGWIHNKMFSTSEIIHWLLRVRLRGFYVRGFNNTLELMTHGIYVLQCRHACKPVISLKYILFRLRRGWRRSRERKIMHRRNIKFREINITSSWCIQISICIQKVLFFPLWISIQIKIPVFEHDAPSKSYPKRSCFLPMKIICGYPPAFMVWDLQDKKIINIFHNEASTVLFRLFSNYSKVLGKWQQ